MKSNIIIVCVCTAFLLTGCSLKGGKSVEALKNQGEKVETFDQFPVSYEREGEQVIFDTKIVIDCVGDENQAYTGTAKLQPIDYDSFRSLMHSQEMIQEEKEVLENYFGDSYESRYYYSSDKGDAFSIDFHSAFYTTSFTKYVNSAFQPLAEAEGYNGNVYMTNEDLPGFTREEAFGQLKKVLEDADCKIYDEYECYTLDHEQMRKEECVWIWMAI